MSCHRPKKENISHINLPFAKLSYTAYFRYTEHKRVIGLL